MACIRWFRCAVESNVVEPNLSIIVVRIIGQVTFDSIGVTALRIVDIDSDTSFQRFGIRTSPITVRVGVHKHNLGVLVARDLPVLDGSLLTRNLAAASHLWTLLLGGFALEAFVL